MDFESLEPPGTRSRLDGVRFVHKVHVHEKVREYTKMKPKGTLKGSQGVSLDPLVVNVGNFCGS